MIGNIQTEFSIFGLELTRVNRGEGREN
jgi:hypothetical protein